LILNWDIRLGNFICGSFEGVDERSVDTVQFDGAIAGYAAERFRQQQEDKEEG
jgi:hypothetical protein